MNKPTHLELNIQFPIDRPENGYVFTREVVENALKKVDRLPIIEYGETERVVGCVDKCELNGETLIVSGTIFEKLADGVSDLEYTYENGKLNFVSFGVISKNTQQDETEE